MTCYCNGDIDDICLDLEEDILACTYCSGDVYEEDILVCTHCSKGELTMKKPYFNNNELYIIADAIFNRRLEAKTELEKIEEGRIDKSAYEYWKQIYDDCDKLYIKLIKYIIK